MALTGTPRAISLVPARNQHGRGFQIDHISHHAAQHLTRDLSADSPVHEVTPGKIFRQAPAVGNGIAQEDDARGLRQRGAETRVRVRVPFQIVAIGIAPLPVLQFEQRLKIGVHPVHGVAQFRHLPGCRFRERILLG